MTAPVIEATCNGPSTSAGPLVFPPHNEGDLLVVLLGAGDSVAISESFSVSGSGEGAFTHEIESECYRAEELDFPTHEFHMFWAHAAATRASNYTVSTASSPGGQGMVLAGLVISGTDQTNPIDTSSSGCGPMSTTTSVDIPGVTTSTADCLVIHGVCAAQLTGGSGTATMSSWSNGSLSSFGEVIDFGITSGNDKTIAASAGVMSSAGATGNATATSSLGRYLSYGCFAIKPGGPTARWYAGRIVI